MLPTAIKLDDKLPLSLEPKCSITCQLLFRTFSPEGAFPLYPHPVAPPTPENGLVLAVEVGVERGVVVSVPLSCDESDDSFGGCFKLVHRLPIPRRNVELSVSRFRSLRLSLCFQSLFGVESVLEGLNIGVDCIFIMVV